MFCRDVLPPQKILPCTSRFIFVIAVLEEKQQFSGEKMEIIIAKKKK